jgi:cell division protein FtsB
VKLPTALRRTAGSRRRRPVLTPRALVLGGLVVLLVVVLASPLSHYLGSRAEVARAARQLHDDQAALRRLTAEKARWSDPGFVQEQARTRLMYAMPGDTVYIVADKNHPSLIERTSGTPASGSRVDRAWSGRLWDSVRAAAG